MTVIPSRDEMEARLARVLAKTNRETLNLILDLLGDPPDASKLTPEIWEQIQLSYERELNSELEKVFIVAALILTTLLSIGLDWALMNERAANWARQYTRDLVIGMNANSRRLTAAALNDFANGIITRQALQERLARIFGAVRAEAISITEVTRALIAGGQAFATDIRGQGFRVRALVKTSEDDRVCAVCAPKNNLDPAQVGYPPYHVKCRCDVLYELEPVAT